MRFDCDFVWVVSCVFEVFLILFWCVFDCDLSCVFEVFWSSFAWHFYHMLCAFSNAFSKYLQLVLLRFVYVLSASSDAFYFAFLMLFSDAFYCAFLMIFSDAFYLFWVCDFWGINCVLHCVLLCVLLCVFTLACFLARFNTFMRLLLRFLAHFIMRFCCVFWRLAFFGAKATQSTFVDKMHQHEAQMGC